MKINGISIDDTFAEAFPMKACRLIITALSPKWTFTAANSMRGFASSVIACGCEADIERLLGPEESPDGRDGIAMLVFAMSVKDLERQVPTRVGQSVMTTATTACYNGLDSERHIPLGSHLRYFGDGFQIAKQINGRRYWRVPVMHGEFLCEESAGVVPAIGGGNFLVLAKSAAQALAACERAVETIRSIPGVITPFPGGIVGSGSKVGSKYRSLGASTNERYCPTLRGRTDSELDPGIECVLEVVVDGLSTEAIGEALRLGILAICESGRNSGVERISAGNYGGNLGPHHFHLHELLQ